MKYYDPYDVNDPNAPGGWRPREKPKREVAENFDPYHDELGRFTTKDGAAPPRGADSPHPRDWRDKNISVFISDTQIAPAQTDAEHPHLYFNDVMHNYPLPQQFPTEPTPGKTTFSDLIGGKVAENHFTNTCAVRLSHALNKSGLTIKHFKGNIVTSGADKMWYFRKVSDLDTFLRKRLGDPETFNPKTWKDEINIDPKTRIPTLRKGIIEFEVPFSDATGHFSLWDGSSNVDGPDHDYSNQATRIDFWPLDPTDIPVEAFQNKDKA